MKLLSIKPRIVVQILMVMIIAVGAAFRSMQHALARFFPELQGFCPIGAVQTLFRITADPSSLLRPERSHLWVLSGVLLITLLFGAVFCSYLCPLGSLQEWVGKAGKKLFKKSYNRPIPKKADAALGSLRYIFIAFIGLSVFGIISFNFDVINPSYAFIHVWSSAVSATAVVVLLLIVILSLFYERPWCRWLCPYGVLLGVLGKISLFKIRKSEELCINCKKCSRACHAHIAVQEASTVADSRCTRCSRCIDVCPVKGALSTTGPSHGAAAAALVFVLFFSPLTAARAGGLYLPGGIREETQAAVFDPDSISPVITIGELARLMGIEYHELTELLGLPEAYDGETMLFDIEEDIEHEHITVGFIREQVVLFFSIEIEE